MQTDRFSNVQSRSRDRDIDVGLRNHMQSVYNRMTIGLLITGITAFIVSSSPALMALIFGGPQMYIVAFAPVALVWFGFNPMSMSSQKLMVVFGAIAVLYGVSLSTLAFAFTGAELTRAFFITAGMFAGLSIFGYTTKKDLSALGTFCVMGILGVFLISIVGMFVGFSSEIHFFLSVASVGLFAGVTAWETQSMRQMYRQAHGAEVNSRLAWSSALSLYISFIAIFVNILQIMQER